MKLWEVIKELTEDPTKKFERRDPAWVETIGCEDGFLVYTSEFRGEVIEHGRITENADLNDSDWQLVRQPVTWQEAVQEFAKGKKLIVKFNNQEWTLDALVEVPKYLDVAITKGEWYVED